jgi:hypothetical protein
MAWCVGFCDLCFECEVGLGSSRVGCVMGVVFQTVVFG